MQRDFRHLDLPSQHPLRDRIWREWCFLRVAFRRFRLRMAILLTVLLGGGLLFMSLEKGHSLAQAVFYTWALVFGEPPEAFPESLVLQMLFFIVPIIGLTVIIEGIIDFALMLRDRRRYERSWCVMMTKAMSNHIVLVGFGRLGYRTFTLLRRLGEQVVVIERAADNQFLEEVRREGSPLLIGDARREALLEEANIAKARSIVLATNDDLANLECALDARRVNPEISVVLRVFDQNMADKIGEGFNIRMAMSQSAISAPTFATAAIEPSLVSSYVVDDQLVVMQRWLVRDAGPLSGKTIGEIMREFSVSVVEYRPLQGEARLFPPPDVVVERGDRVIVQGAFDTILALQKQARELQAEH